jgi:DNA-binding response OmpR family regulator
MPVTSTRGQRRGGQAQVDELGADDYVTKPFRLADLQNR